MRYEELPGVIAELIEKGVSGHFYVGELKNDRRCLVYDDGKRFHVVPLSAYGTKYATKELHMLIPQIVLCG